MKIVFATNNAHKLSEVSQALGEAFTLVTPRECGITEDIPEARYIRSRTGLDCFADDTGLEVEALGGEPGVHSARYATDGHDDEANKRLLLQRLEGVRNRRARFRTAIALIDGDGEHLFEGVVYGDIACEEHGADGFGYDPLFIPEGEQRTFAQMSAEEKNAISHRGRAVRRLAEYLQNRK